MSTESTHYEAICGGCGKVGEYIQSSDDWGNSSEHWNGFDVVASSEYEVARMRSGPERARCACGSLDIRQGPVLRRT